MTTELNWVYQKLGIKRTNVRWSTGGRDEDGKIYLNLWWHFFDGNKYVYKRRSETQSAGFKEMLKLITEVVEKHNGVFGGIVITARDKDAFPRQVARAWRTGDLRITSYNEDGSFTAVRV
jgi:hypothetical protein